LKTLLNLPGSASWKKSPLEGEHWEEIGISNRGRSTPSSGSESDSDDIQSHSEDSTLSTLSGESPSNHRNTATPLTPPINEALRNRMIVEQLQKISAGEWIGEEM